ncbi:sensor histidine kinase [Aquimarina sp. AU119]|uniref:sensor histidine kinase n=1 Tax=Aquimarina sp. AU119 TaxID=2108528 RepID=UPI000D6948AF|nr:sensor histidine kinase [Aquimarina sp. AU119]
MNKKHLFIIVSFFTTICISQDDKTLAKTIEYLLENQIEEAYTQVKKAHNSKEKEILVWHIDARKNGIKDSIFLNENNETISSYNIMNLLRKGDIHNQSFIKNDSLILQSYRKALDLSIQKKDTLLTRLTFRKLLKFTFGNRKLFELLDEYLDIYNNYLKTPTDSAYYDYYKYTNISYRTNKPYIKVYKKALKSIEKKKNYLLQGTLYQILGIQQSHFNKKNDSAIYYFNKATEKYNKVSDLDIEKEEKLFGIYNNLGVAYNYSNQPKIALQYFKKANKYKIPKNSFLKKSYLYLAIAETHKNLKNFDSAYHYINKEKEALKQFNEYEIALKLNEIETKYQTVEKEKRIVQLLNVNLKTEASRIRNRNFLIGSISILIVGFIIALLIYKNTRRKQRIAEQERQIEIQKTEKLLKDQELTAIDAMISGQEKERQRLANELHDNLGSTLATVKLHFQHLTKNRNNSKIENLEELYAKTDHLLEEAYQKVRTIAHEKNSGVMANQGLLPAIKKFAKKASNGDALQIVVQDYGLEERLDNALEISIFRMIQELITNIIKHANATEVHISLTNHDSLLNIIIEDNGKGFDTKVISQKDGMGLRTIEKRIEHLEGTFEIDSTIGKGTNIIINIPI